MEICVERHILSGEDTAIQDCFEALPEATRNVLEHHLGGIQEGSWHREAWPSLVEALREMRTSLGNRSKKAQKLIGLTK
jgi:hypothetical protein